MKLKFPFQHNITQAGARSPLFRSHQQSDIHCWDGKILRYPRYKFLRHPKCKFLRYPRYKFSRHPKYEIQQKYFLYQTPTLQILLFAVIIIVALLGFYFRYQKKSVRSESQTNIIFRLTFQLNSSLDSAQSWRVGLSGVRERGNWFLRPSVKLPSTSQQVKLSPVIVIPLHCHLSLSSIIVICHRHPSSPSVAMDLKDVSIQK